MHRRRLIALAAVCAATALMASACTSSASGTSADGADIELVTTQLRPDDPARAGVPPELLGSLTTSTQRPVRTSTTRPDSTSDVPSSTTTSAPTTTVAPTSSTTPAPTTSAQPTTTFVGPPPWRIGLLNTGASASGSYEAFRLGVEAAVEWWNYTAAASGKRQIALDSCAPTDEVSTVACADELVQSNTALVHGIDLYSELSLPVIEASGLPVLGGVAVRPVDADARNAGLDIGGPPAAHAALGALAVDRQLATVVVLHDATEVSRELIDRFTRPVLQNAGIVASYVEVPPGTTDATGVVAAASVELGEAWLVATSSRSCGAIAASRRHFGVTTPVIWGTACTTPAVLDNYGDLMVGDTVAFELIEPRLLDFVNSELRAGYELANQVLLQYDPELVDDPLAVRGWLVGTRLTQTLDRSGGDLSASRDVRAPNPISAGEIACGTNPTAICAADIMFFGWNGSTVEAPMVVLDGLAEPAAQSSGVAPSSG